MNWNSLITQQCVLYIGQCHKSVATGLSPTFALRQIIIIIIIIIIIKSLRIWYSDDSPSSLRCSERCFVSNNRLLHSTKFYVKVNFCSLSLYSSWLDIAELALSLMCKKACFQEYDKQTGIKDHGTVPLRSKFGKLRLSKKCKKIMSIWEHDILFSNLSSHFVRLFGFSFVPVVRCSILINFSVKLDLLLTNNETSQYCSWQAVQLCFFHVTSSKYLPWKIRNSAE